MLNDVLNFTQATDKGFFLCFKTVANAQQTGFIIEENFLKLKIKAPAVDGKANKAIIEYLSKFFSVSKNKIEILNGEKSRNKRVLIKSQPSL